MGSKISINSYNSEGLLLLKQFTEEKLGKAERTDLDPHFEDLGRKTDKVKTYTEKLVKDTEAVLVPNPGKILNTQSQDLKSTKNIKL